jgi:hypothetical protein
MTPKEAWKVCRDQFAKTDGLNATSDDDNADILKNQFQAVFDRKDVTTGKQS